MSSLKEAYLTPTSLHGWDTREWGVRHLQCTVLNALLFLFSMWQHCHPSSVGVERNTDRRDVECAFLPTVRIWS